MAQPTTSAWPVAVFAHNEADHIIAALDRLFTAAPGRELAIQVLANGCTDDTEKLVQAYAKNRPQVRLVSLHRGDKANAWNHFVHRAAPDAEVYFFTDGDVRVSDGALIRLYDSLRGQPQANAAGAIAYSGRNQQLSDQAIIQERGLHGNLYALRGSFVRRIRERDIGLPIGFIGDDGLVGALAKWDLDPTGEWDDDRVAVCPEAGFEFDSLDPFGQQDRILYLRRLLRYSLRHFQFQMLGPLLKSQGIEAMPVTVEELYQHHDKCRLTWRGLSTIPDIIALRRIRKIAGAATKDR